MIDQKSKVDAHHAQNITPVSELGSSNLFFGVSACNKHLELVLHMSLRYRLAYA